MMNLGVWLLIIMGVIAVYFIIMLLMKSASNADDKMLGDRQYEESPPANVLYCARCGKPGVIMAALPQTSGGKILVHRGGCPK